MRAKIIAVDFDGTLIENGKWPDIGATNETVLNYCKDEQANGARIILWTNRVGEPLEIAIKWCEEHGLRLDAVNDNLPESVEFFGANPRKIYADEYIDDRMAREFDLPYDKDMNYDRKRVLEDIVTILIDSNAVTCSVEAYEPCLIAGAGMYKIPSNHRVIVNYNILAKTLYDAGYRKIEESSDKERKSHDKN